MVFVITKEKIADSLPVNMIHGIHPSYHLGSAVCITVMKIIIDKE